MTARDCVTLRPEGPLKGEITAPSDKSISHRAIIFASIGKGISRIRNFLRASDPMSTLNAMSALGVEIIDNIDEIVVHGRGLYGLKEPEDIIDCGNSGTTMRLLTGLLSAQKFLSILTGDESLRQRPMKRVITPLTEMGATIYGRKDNSLAPVAIRGQQLRPIKYRSPVASAQVKSAILLAGLYIAGTTTVEEPSRSRDHTERILPTIGASIEVEKNRVSIRGPAELSRLDITIPGDFSSAAFFLVAATIVKDSEILIKNTLLNPTRTGLLNVMERMGVSFEILNTSEVSGEPVGDILCRFTSQLKATEIRPEEVPSMIDEFPIFSVLATQADGVSVIRGARELRVKESDRIGTMTSELRKLGAEIEELPDGMTIKGPVKLKGAVVESHGDHRVAMALSVAALVAEGETKIEGISSVEISFPGFYEKLRDLVS
ncbi:MAG TPA: 3-phosphoshikimate 1-carboxyvinyltransferase [Nitrospirae bacterium]|nr:3-phosphoshikimate 1-carboxyvinyltransferase [Nitrospirota bacterium]